MIYGEQQMKKAAANLPSFPLLTNHVLEVSYLTGKRYWHQTAFCAYSLAKILQGKIKINIYSDGSLSKYQSNVLSKGLPGIEIIKMHEILHQLEKRLPQNSFPTLRFLRENNPFFRKLIDMRLNDRYIVQLDSDMLFFNTPSELLNSYQTGGNYFMQDTLQNSYYVLDEKIIEEHLKVNIKEKINSGILAYNSKDIDWVYVEECCKFLLDRIEVISPPMFEQTLNAIIISKLNGKPLDDSYHILYDSDKEIKQESDVVRHYIFKAKKQYFINEWKKIIH